MQSLITPRRSLQHQDRFTHLHAVNLLANDIYTPAEGKRLFALIAFGASSGAAFGAYISGHLIDVLGVHAMLLVAAAILAVSLIVFNVAATEAELIIAESIREMPT